jgi:hypothetical protein
MTFVLFCIMLSLFFKALIWFHPYLDSVVINIPRYESLNLTRIKYTDSARKTASGVLPNKADSRLSG